MVVNGTVPHFEPMKNSFEPLDFADDLDVEAQQVIQGLEESGDGSEEIEGVMRAMPVVVVEEGVEAF